MGDYLKERSGRFYHRVRIPADLKDAFDGRCELSRSLRTADPQEAKVIAADCRARAERLFFQVRCGMLSPEQIRKMVDAYFERNLTEAEEARLDRIGLLEDNEEGRSNADGLSLHLEELSEDLARGNYRNISRIADSMLEESGVTLDRNSRDYTRLCREALKGAVEATKVELERTLGKYRGDSGRLSVGGEKKEEGEKLSRLIAAYSHEMASGGRWRGRTKTEAEGCLKLLLALVGDRNIRTITRQDLRGGKKRPSIFTYLFFDEGLPIAEGLLFFWLMKLAEVDGVRCLTMMNGIMGRLSNRKWRELLGGYLFRREEAKES